MILIFLLDSVLKSGGKSDVDQFSFYICEKNEP